MQSEKAEAAHGSNSLRPSRPASPGRHCQGLILDLYPTTLWSDFTGRLLAEYVPTWH